MNYFWTILPLIAVIVYQGWLIWHIQGVHESRERDLMDRVMSRNYETFIQAETIRGQANNPQPPVYEEERGIPI